MMKKLILGLMVARIACMNLSAFAIAPSFNNSFENSLTTDPSGKGETLFSPKTFKVSTTQTLQQNVFNLFSPANNSSVLWNVVKIIMIGVLVLYFARTGIDFLMNPNDEAKLKNAKRSFIYLLFGTFLIYGVTWILGSALQISVVQGSQQLVSNLIGRVLFQVLAFLKSLAFFYAIVMTIWYGISMIRALDKEDAIKSARKGILNIVLALIFIKVVDFVFFIAQDVAFASKTKQFVINIARIIGYILGALMVMALIFAGYKYLGAGGDEAKVKSAKNVLMNIFYVVIITFLFLLVTRQIIAEFT